MKYALPARREFEAAETATGFAGVDYDQTGSWHARPSHERRKGREAGERAAGECDGAGDGRAVVPGPEHEIAAAVREAMLNLNSINDVVNDL